MKHVTFADRSLLMDSATADMLLRYAALIGSLSRSEVVTLNAIGSDGDEVEASFLLNSCTNLMVESANTTATEPDNHVALTHMLERMQELNDPFRWIGDDPSLSE